MSTIPLLPTPPKPLFDLKKRLEVYQQMQSDLEQQAAYQQKAIAFHSESLELLKKEAENTQNELNSCQNIIESLTSNVSSQPQTASNGHQAVVVDAEIKPELETEPTKTKTKSLSKAKAKTPVKTNKSSTTKSKAEAKQATKKVKVKPASTLPPSKVIEQYESITDMVLDFVIEKEGVIEVSDVIKYAYPDGLEPAQRKKAASSFSSVLGLQAKKGKLERTVPGKYLWKKN
jgi:hypothetical protein